MGIGGEAADDGECVRFPRGAGSLRQYRPAPADNNEHYQIYSLVPAKRFEPRPGDCKLKIGVSGQPAEERGIRPKPLKAYDFFAFPLVPVTLDIRPAHGLNSGYPQGNRM